jgi:V/A-type H+-transporting ATPase subunit I
MAIFFPFMFGFCLTDAFYGIIVTILGFVLVMGMGKTNESFNALGKITIHCGIWGIILGFAAYGFLGDFFPKYLGIALPHLIDAFQDPVTVLIFAIAVGIIHVNIATIIGIIDKLRYGLKTEALSQNIVWLVLEVGVVFLALSMFVPSIGMMGMVIGGVCILATVGLLFYGKGAFGIMDIFSFMGNILSYARLLALCLSTAGIAMTVNILANLMYEMIPIAAIAIIIAAIVFVFGHIANFLIQIVGGFINTMRLHFVEFFTHFYMGGHNAFKPFSSNRLITKLKNK